MPISTVLLTSIFLLCCTGAAELPCRNIGVFPGNAAALTLAVILLSALPATVAAGVELQPAALLMAGFGLLLNRRNRRWVRAVPPALACAAAAWALRNAFPNCYEPGALLAIPAALAGRFLLRSNRQGLLCVLLAPLCYGLIVTVEDWYLFDFVRFSLGNALQLDMQACGTVYFALLTLIPKPARARPAGVGRKRFNMQKEA